MTALFRMFDLQFVFSLFSIVLVDLTLSGDNAVVIAAAARRLPHSMRKQVLIGGAACAVIALVTAAFFATRLLRVPFSQLLGGVAVLWIALSMFGEEPTEDSVNAHGAGLWKAMWLIVAADVTMSLDNVLAVAAIAQGNVALLLFGLSLSIPLVVLASGLLASLMDRYPLIVYIGAALLGRVAGQMMISDPFTVRVLAPSAALRYSVEALGAAGVLLGGLWIKRTRTEKEE
jgi:YjbE family integral membrane protein